MLLERNAFDSIAFFSQCISEFLNLIKPFCIYVYVCICIFRMDSSMWVTTQRSATQHDVEWRGERYRPFQADNSQFFQINRNYPMDPAAFFYSSLLHIKIGVCTFHLTAPIKSL